MKKNRQKAVVICGFPGIGKTTLFKKDKDLKILDSDSSKFSWATKERKIPHPNFPENYIKHIKNNLSQADMILVSSHGVVRKALVKENIKFTLVYPSVEIKGEYIQRFIGRGSDESFIELLKTSYEKWINGLMNQKNCKHIILQSGQYLADVIQLNPKGD